MWLCPQCGEWRERIDFEQGVCLDCFEANQDDLDRCSIEYELWKTMSDRERDEAIRWAKENG